MREADAYRAGKAAAHAALDLMRQGQRDGALRIVPHRGKVWVYWGTESQGVDSILAGDGVDHPAYRGQAYLVFEKLFFGENRTNAPQIEVVAARWPRPSWLTADEAIQDDANPVAVLWDLWTHPRYGLGLPKAG